MEMLTRDQADRIATAIQVVRPEWAHSELMATLSHGDIQHRRTYTDTFHAALAIALDPATQHPNRLLSAGPWWTVRAVTEPVNTTAVLPHIDWSTACHECGQSRDNHRAADHSWQRPTAGVPMPDDVRQLVKTNPRESA